jgi:hypothetical protein
MAFKNKATAKHAANETEVLTAVELKTLSIKYTVILDPT